MRTTSLMVALLVAAALAGCTGGSSNEGQPDDPTTSGTSSPSPTPSRTRGPDGQRGGEDRAYDAYLEVSPDNGTAPLNVTLTFGATWQDSGRRAGQDGNGTGGSSANQTSSGPAANGTGNQTGASSGNGTGNQTGASGGSGNGTPNDGSHPVNRGHDVTWTLEVRLVASGTTGNSTGNGTSQGNATGNGTSQGNATGNQTGNGTSTTSASQTTTGSPGNETGNGTSSQTNTTTGSGNGTAPNGTATGTLVASFNGTGEDLPGNETLVLDETGSYTVTFTVTPDDGGDVIVRDASIAVEPLPPGSPLGNETSTFEGSFLASAAFPCLGSEDFEWVLNSTFAGAPADVSRLNVTADVSGLNGFGMTLFAPNETEIASGEEIHVEGPFTNGTYVLRAESCVAADVEYTITAIAHYTTPGYVANAAASGEETP